VTKILQTDTDSKCRLCKKFDEALEHIISSFPIPAKVQYIKRHDRVCAQLHFNICKEIGVKIRQQKHWYDHAPKAIKTCHASKVMEPTSVNQQNYS